MLEVREPEAGLTRARYTWFQASRFCLISVLYVDGYGVGVPMAVFVTVQEGRGGQLRVCRPTL